MTDNKITGSISELRKFGITMAVAVGLLSGLLFWRNKEYYWYFLIISLMFLFLGLCLPVSLKYIYKGWMFMATAMGWFMTRLILLLLFYFVFTPIGLLLKLFGKKLLDIEFEDNSANSYWLNRQQLKFEKDRYDKQF